MPKIYRRVIYKLANTYSITFQEIATEYLGYTTTRNEKEKTMSLSQKGSNLKLLDLFPRNFPCSMSQELSKLTGILRSHGLVVITN